MGFARSARPGDRSRGAAPRSEIIRVSPDIQLRIPADGKASTKTPTATGAAMCWSRICLGEYEVT